MGPFAAKKETVIVEFPTQDRRDQRAVFQLTAPAVACPIGRFPPPGRPQRRLPSDCREPDEQTNLGLE